MSIRFNKSTLKLLNIIEIVGIIMYYRCKSINKRRQKNMSKKLLIYTREPLETDIYDAKLAYSMHLALEEDGGFIPLNHNSGVFFARATENAEDGSLNPKSLKSPFAFELKDGGYGVFAIRTEGDGSADPQSAGCALLAVTDDFLSYRELGLVKLCDEELETVDAKYCQNCGAYRIIYTTKSGMGKCKMTDLCSLKAEQVEPCANNEGCPHRREGQTAASDTGIEGANICCQVDVPDEIAIKLKNKLTTPVNVAVELPDKISASSAEELEAVKALARYSDGSTDEKRVKWNLSEVDFSRPGTYKINGELIQEHYSFPIAINRADPCVAKWNGKYYFIATNDADGNHTLYIRCADTIEGLVDAEEVLLLDSDTYEGIGGLLWAPEFHEINGKLYIFHGATPGEFFWEESHLMVLKDGGDPMNRNDWSRTRRVTKKDGSELCEAGKVITLDMTCFMWEGDYYVVWSQRQFVPKDLGAWLYIAKLDPSDPWKLLTDPVVLSKPDYGWANNHTFVDEGPFALIRGDKIYLSFSSALVDATYCVGLLKIEKGKDLLDPSNWVKTNYPLLTSRSVEGEYGPGHNAYVTDDYGKVWNTYHARPGVNSPRSSGIRRVHFDIYGEPVLDMTEELDIKPELKKVTTTLNIK